MSENNFTDFRCPYCGKAITFPQESISTLQDCPWCSGSVLVPEAGVPVATKLPIPIVTSRLTLRRIRVTDRQDLSQLASDAESVRYLDWELPDEDEFAGWIERDRSAKLNEPGGYLWLVLQVSQTAKVIGYIALEYLEGDTKQAAFTVLVSRSYQRHGYGTESVRAALGLLLQAMGLHRVAVSCDRRNIAARRMLEKVGMRQEGDFTDDRYVKGEWVSTIYFALLRSDYMKSSAPEEQKA